MSEVMHRGGCLCGAVKFVVRCALEEADACHCSRCRRLSGHFWSSTNVPRDALEVEGAEHVTWFSTSERVRRGFCSTCGAQLFWDPLPKDTIAVAMGAFELPTKIRLTKHIFVADKGDYYEIADGLPQNEQ